MVLIDRRSWRDFQREFPPDLGVLETIAIQGQELVIARAGGRSQACGEAVRARRGLGGPAG